MPFQSTPTQSVHEAALVAEVENETRHWLEMEVFPGTRLMGGLSPSNSYVDVAPGVIQSIEENRVRHQETRRMVAAGEPVAWKWGL